LGPEIGSVISGG